jgi:hypothetical protein
MNRAFQSFTPRSHPLDYDALIAREGCEAESGNDFFHVLAFDRICLFAHDADDYTHTQPDTVAYSIGPEQTGTAGKPFLTTWTAWVGSFGVRIGIVGRITPPSDNTGDVSTLYPATKPTKLSIAFDRDGLLHMAIQKTTAEIEVKYYTDTEGTIATRSWTGYSAVLWYSGELVRNDPPDAPAGTIVCYYLRTDQPKKIYARFSDEGYATEYTVMPDLRAEPTRLIGVAAVDQKAELRFIDSLGRDGTLYSPQYAITIQESATLDVTFDSGLVFAAAVPADDQLEKATLAISFANGVYFDAVVTTTAQRDDGAATLVIAFDSGSYDLG